MTNQSVALSSTKSPSASPASHIIAIATPTSLADLSVHNCEEEVKDLADFDMIGRKVINQRYGCDTNPNKPRAYEAQN